MGFYRKPLLVDALAAISLIQGWRSLCPTGLEGRLAAHQFGPDLNG